LARAIDTSPEFREFVKEQHAMMGERDFAGPRVQAAADQGRHAGGVMWRAKNGRRLVSAPPSISPAIEAKSVQMEPPPHTNSVKKTPDPHFANCGLKPQILASGMGHTQMSKWRIETNG
jgi:hypothetical protein